MSDWTVTDKLRSLEREIRYRHRVYPRLVARGEMDEHNARREIAIMEAIADDYRRERNKDDLFAAKPDDHEGFAT